MKAAAKTIEEVITEANKNGWRVSSLSFIAGQGKYSCLLERKKPAKDGFPVFAASGLCDTEREAFNTAWERARMPIESSMELNPKVFQQIRAKLEGSNSSPLEAYLEENVGPRLRLEDAFRDLGRALAGDEFDDGDEL